MYTSLTGWEIERSESNILANKKKEVEQLLQNYPLCAWDEAEESFWIIRKYHPVLQREPDTETEFRYGLLYHFPSGHCCYFLPHYTYTQLSIKPRDGYSQITITSDEVGDIVTNKNELGRKLLYGIKTEEERDTVFKSLCDEIKVKQKVVSKEKEITSAVLGVIPKGEFDDWWTLKAVEIPYWNKQNVPITFANYTPALDANFMAEADSLLQIFLAKTNQDRIDELTHLLHQDCINFISDVWDEENEMHHTLAHLAVESEIWNYIYLKDLYVERIGNTDEMQLILHCDCEWDDEHGVDLAYNKEGKLIDLEA